MALVDLSLLKAHVRADDFTEDDDYLSSVLEAAEAWVVQATARAADELVELGGGAFPSQLRQAVLLLAGHLYNQREAVGSSSLAEVPYTVQALVKPFRRLVVGDADTGTSSGTSDSEILAAVERVQTAVEGNAEEIAKVREVVEGISKEVSGTVSADLSKVKAAVAEVQTDVAGVKSGVADVKSDVAEVKASTEGLGDKIDDVQTDVTALAEDMDDVFNVLDDDTKTITDAIAGVKSDTEGLVQTITDGVTEVKGAIADTGKEVAGAVAGVQTTADEIKAEIENIPSVTEMTAERTAEIINEENE